MLDALARGDFETVERLGHCMKGAGALHSGALTLLAPGSQGLPKTVLSYHRSHGEDAKVEVYLNFSKHEAALDLGARAVRVLFSTHADGPQETAGRYLLLGHEGIVITDRRPDAPAPVGG